MSKKNQLAEEELRLENERKVSIRKYDLRRKILCGAIFLKKIYEDQNPEVIHIFREELQKSSLTTQEEFPEIFGKENSIFGSKVQLITTKNVLNN